MWDTYSEDRAPRADIGRIVRIAVFAAISVIIFGVVGNQSVNLFMNVKEFGEVFTRPLYYSILSGVVLSAIALVRVNFKARHSVIWYGIKSLINVLKRGDYESQSKPSRYSEFQMSKTSFALWQLMKVLLFAPLFSSIVFGMATEYVIQGKDLGIGSLGNVFAIPFVDMPVDGSYAKQNVIPMIPALTFLVPPLLTAVGVRLLVYVGISGTANILSQYVLDSKESKPRFLSYISTMEIIAGVSILWIGFNMFFSGGIDYNTRYAIAGAMTLGAALIVYGLVDRRHARVIIYPDRKRMYARLFTAAVVVGLAGSIMLVNNSIAGSTEMNVPYVAQEIELNRYMHGLDQVQIVNHTVARPSISPSDIQSMVEQNSDVLGNIRLWDEKNAKDRLVQELSQRSDLKYFDFDVLRFGGSMYWTGTTFPVIPENVAQNDEWFYKHIVYTHSDVGMKMLAANNGSVVDESKFFEQRRIYYGESDDGLFSTYWSAYPVDRAESDELGGYMYNGTGGVDIAPPLSWMFEPNFMVSNPGTPMHVMRYKEIHDRMELLYPYFVYEFGFGSAATNPLLKEVEAFAVTDGTDTYWLMPLIVAINTSNVPLSSSSSSFMLQHVGYSLIDAYDGTMQIIVTGDDFFSEMFLDQYEDIGATRDVPLWLADQIKYPEEMFMWQVSKFNTYHVTDPRAFIEANDVYEVPRGQTNEVSLPTYAYAEPPGFEQPEFVGMQLLQQEDSESNNIAGYIIVQNDLEDLGKMTFYSVPADSQAKLVNTVGAQDALKKDPSYSQIREEKFGSANPPLGESNFHRVGNYEVYFIPIFTGTGGKQVGTVGAVGAASDTGTHLVGFGDTPALAFENYLQKLSGNIPAGQPSGNQTAPDRQHRIQNLEKVFTDAGLELVKPTVVAAPVGFMEAGTTYRVDSERAVAEEAIRAFIANNVQEGERIFEWQEATAVNFGVLRTVDGIVESHYISIEVG
ncbi:MAG: UPF0182 family protein [Thermoproteota archaeon]